MQVELLRPHTHQGTKLSPGELIEVADRKGEWLIDMGVARPVKKSRKQPKEKQNAEH